MLVRPVYLTIEPFVVGIGPYRSGDAPFNGMIDEVRIYKRALCASEIQWLYANP